MVWRVYVDNGNITIAKGNGKDLCPEQRRKRTVPPALACLQSESIGHRYFVCYTERPTGSIHSATYYYVREGQ